MFLQEWFECYGSLECKEINPEVVEKREWNQVRQRMGLGTRWLKN